MTKKTYSFRPSPAETKDAIFAFILLLLLCYWITELKIFLPIMLGSLILAMLAPKLFYPFAVVWYGLGVVLNAVMSKVILGTIFYTIVVPVGVIRKCFGYDPLRTQTWHSSKGSAFVERSHKFSKEDFDTPY